MSFKKKMGWGLVIATLGISLVVGGSLAYFSDQVESNNTFAAGTLDLSLDPEVVVELDDLKPGDSLVKEFSLTNGGTLDIEKINLDTNYNVNDLHDDNTEDFGKYIKVNFLWNWDKEKEPIFKTTLKELKNMSPNVVEENLQPLIEGGLKPEESNDFWVEFEFVDNDGDQNEFQGDSLDLTWTFNAVQGDGKEYDET